MGLFDFFSRRSRADAAPEGDSPRCDHYSFAHVVLRDDAFDNPVQCVTQLASADSMSYIANLWESVKHISEEHGEPVTLEPEDILVHQVAVGSWPCALIEMPAAAHKTEAFFVALVLKVDLADRDRGFEAEPLSLFTLEFSETNSIDEIQTVIGEWSRDGTHASLGPGPEPEPEAFVSSIEQIMTGRRLN
ncbi:MAG: hypothetical protein ACYTGL_03490 [Planctomycetota bacterium]|jgi:hypothetical protein